MPGRTWVLRGSMAVPELREPGWMCQEKNKREPAAAEQEMLPVQAPEGGDHGRFLRHKKRPLTWPCQR